MLLLCIVLPLSKHGINNTDGVLYAAMAKNLSLGIGTLWAPIYSLTSFHPFFEHPPLALYFQSIFFKILGQHWWVEKLYSFSMAFCQFSLISWYWLHTKKTSFYSLALLLFIWVCIPFNHLYVDNLMPATLSVFTTFSSLLLLVAARPKAKLFFQYFIAACSVVIAFFCDGPLALFTIMVPLLAIIQNTQPSIKMGLRNTFLFSILICICVFLY